MRLVLLLLAASLSLLFLAGCGNETAADPAQSLLDAPSADALRAPPDATAPAPVPVLADGTAEAPARDSAVRLNVLCIVVDTLRADHLGAYGYTRPTTPTLDALGARSLVVPLIAQSSWTKPSIASLFTSLLPCQHGATEETTRNRLADSQVTLAELLAQAGYFTAGYSENPHIGSFTGFDQGFGQFQTLSHFDGNEGWLLERARDFLGRAAKRDAPFFLYVHLLDPHGPYEPNDERRNEFVGELETADEWVRAGRVGQLVTGTELQAELTPGDVDYLRALYDAELRQTDDAVAEILALLDEHELDARTVVLVTSDHGEEFLEHGTLKHGYQLFEETTRVPLILHVPGAGARRAMDAVVGHMDIAPTLLDLLGLPVPESFRGQSFAGLLRGEPFPERSIVSETSWRGIGLASLRRGRWKLIADRQAGTHWLFDMVADPAERDDRSAAEPALLAELQSELDAALASGASAALGDTTGTGDPETEKALEALGYFDHE